MQMLTTMGCKQLQTRGWLLEGIKRNSFDDMELLMLEEKVYIEQAHAGGLISDEEYQKQKRRVQRLIMMNEEWLRIFV